MILIFCTDFHGNHSAFKAAFKAAKEHKSQGRNVVVVLGGDILPKGFPKGTPFAKAQGEFFQTWIVPKMEGLRQEGISTYVMWGNDDSRGVLHLLDKQDGVTCHRLDDRGWMPIGDGYYILGFNWVSDYPFSLKDWCCGDLERTPNILQFGDAVYTDSYHTVPSPRPWTTQISLTPSLKDRLESLPLPPDPTKAIFVCHDPPQCWGPGLGRA